MSYFQKCPRCDERSYEVLKTHAYCAGCDYSPDLMNRQSPDNFAIPPWASNIVTAKVHSMYAKATEEANHLDGGAA